MKKKGLFSKNNSDLVPAPWLEVQSRLFLLSVGDKISLPTKRSEYEEIQKGLKSRNDVCAQDVVAFIDFLFKHEELGNIEFQEEVN